MRRFAVDRATTVLVIVLIAFLAVACGTQAEPAQQETSESDSEETSSDGGAEAININFLTLDDPDQVLALEEMAKAFAESDPRWANTTVSFEAVPFAQLFPKIEASVAAGADFDVFLADGPDVKHYAYNGALIPLEEHYTQEEIEAYVPASIEEGSYKGTFYAPPIMQSCSLMFYNKEFTDAAGLEPPKAVEGWTMDEALEAWQQTTVDETGDGTPDVWGMRWGQGTWWGDYEHGIVRRAAGERGSPTFEGMGEDGISFKGYLDTPEAIKGYKAYRSWHQGENAVTPAEPIPDIFVGKQAAFMVTPDNRIGQINRLYPDGGFDYGVTGIPYFEDGAQLCHTGSWHLGVTPASEKQEAAVALVKFMTGKEGSQIWYDHVRQLPARFDLLNTLPEYNEYPQQLFNEALKTIGEPRIQTPCYTEYQQIHAELLQDLAQGTDVDVKQMVESTAGQMEQACTKYKGWNE